MDEIFEEESRYEVYEELLLERDRLEKEADQIWIAYLGRFGKLITDGFEMKIECIKCKKCIAYYQKVLNHGGIIDTAELERRLELEMTGYYAELDALMQQKSCADEAKPVSAYEVNRARTIYRRLAKMIHPDTHPQLEQSEELMELWQRIMDAYHRNLARELAELEVLVRKYLKEEGITVERADIPDIEERIEAVEEDIETIKNTEPYTLRPYVEDEEKARAKEAELQAELDGYRKYKEELDGVILQILANGK